MEQAEAHPNTTESPSVTRQDWGGQGAVICDPDNSDGWIKFQPDEDEVDLSDYR